MYDVIILYYRNRCYCLSSFDSNFLYYSLSPLSADWQIYTDWANHYLEKVKSKRRIQDLPNDVTDGVILADVIEAVGKFPRVKFLFKNVHYKNTSSISSINK